MKVDIKNKSQLDRMRVACRMGAEIRDICAAAVEPGMRTSDIDAIVRDYCIRNKVKASFFGYEGFPGFLCVSVNDEVIHGIPGNRMIMPGDLVKCDVGILTQGYNGDTSRTVMVGVSDPEVIRLVVYHQQTEPLIAYYRERNLLKTVPGVGDLAAIAANVLAVL